MTYCGACEPEGPVEAIFPGTPYRTSANRS
jgi:hypothetical protein